MQEAIVPAMASSPHPRTNPTLADDSAVQHFQKFNDTIAQRKRGDSLPPGCKLPT
jgi:hypothetical protein